MRQTHLFQNSLHASELADAAQFPLQESHLLQRHALTQAHTVHTVSTTSAPRQQLRGTHALTQTHNERAQDQDRHGIIHGKQQGKAHGVDANAGAAPRVV